MTCMELVRYLSDYLDRDLDEALRAEAEAHLAECPNCHAVLDTTRSTISIYRRRIGDGIPAERRHRLLERVRRALGERG